VFGFEPDSADMSCIRSLDRRERIGPDSDSYPDL
jgi:hypothetical protein